MKYNRIIISFILAVTLLINPGTVLFADCASAKVDDIDYVTAAASLGLMPRKLAQTPDAEVSRGDAINAVINLFGDDAASADGVDFSDIDEKSEYYEAVCRAKNLGIVSGFPDNTVRIDEKTAVSHAVKMILYALGYKQIINDGMSVRDAVSRADFCSVSDAFSEDNLTVAKLAQLLVEAGEAYPLVVNNLSNNEGGMSYNYKLSDNPLLEDKLDIGITTGIVTYTGGADLTMEGYSDEGKVVIGGTAYNDSVTAENYIGCNVKAYYKKSNTPAADDILYMYPENNDILKIDAEDISDYSGGSLYYYDGGKRRSENIKIGSVDFVYNNSICTNPTAKHLKPEEGSVKIIDNNRDGRTDVVVVDSYETVVVDAVSKNDGIIYGLYGGVQIDLEKYDSVRFVSEANEKFEIFELSKWDVLSVTRSEDYSTISLVYATGMAEGTVDEIVYDSDDRLLVIGGKEYKVTNDFVKYELSDISVGDEGTFYLNASGKISAYTVNGGKNYGYMIKSAPMQGNFNEDTAAKIFTSGGKMQIFNYAKKVMYNGVSVPKADLGSITGNTLCIYELNDDGEIKSIETAGVGYGFGDFDSGTSIRKIYDGYTESGGLPSQAETLTYKSATAILGGKTCLSSSAVIFEIPIPSTAGAEPDEKYYKVFKRDNYVENDKEMCVQAYNSDPDAIAADAVVVYVKRGDYSATAVYDDTHTWVVEDIHSALAPDGDTRKQLILTDGKMRTTLFAEPSAMSQITFGGRAYTLRNGDIIRCDTDEENNIVACEVLYSVQSDSLSTSNPSTDSFAASFRIELCYAYKISESFLITTITDLKNAASVDEDALENKQLRNLSSYGIVYYNSERKKVLPGNGDLLKCYTRNGRDCSKMFIFDRYGEAKTLVIYD